MTSLPGLVEVSKELWKRIYSLEISFLKQIDPFINDKE